MDWKDRISWIDGYVKKIKPHVRVREKDSILIKIPNQAYKLNPQAVKLLKYLFSGGSIFSVVKPQKDREKASFDVYAFFMDLQALLKGCYNEKEDRIAIEKKRFSIPYNEFPVLSEIAVTYRCNLACSFCYAACGCKKEEQFPELSADRFKKVLDVICKEAEVPSVSFTGGEPLLREDLAELVKHAKSLNMWTNLITNGTLLSEEKAAELKAAGLDSGQVSIEAGNPAIHDQVVRKKGAFEKAAEGITNLMKAGIRVHTNTTISGLNKNFLFDILNFVKDAGLDKFSMNMMMPVGSAKENFSGTFVSYSEIGPLVEGIRKKAVEDGLEFMWYSPTPVCIFNPISKGLGNKGCAALDGLLSIAPNGDILPCSSYRKSMGNMLESAGNFEDLWKSGPFKYFQNKEFAHEICKKCEHIAHCNGACPLYWESVGHAELERAVRCLEKSR
ncbi:MAG: radical SAM protein [Elusimicrobia bacterium]|nr:radical SAM protein [Elusimicrobiota bacterium]